MTFAISGFERWCGGHFCSQNDADPESRNRFRIGANLKFLKILIFQHQLI